MMVDSWTTSFFAEKAPFYTPNYYAKSYVIKIKEKNNILYALSHEVFRTSRENFRLGKNYSDIINNKDEGKFPSFLTDMNFEIPFRMKNE